MAGAEVSVVVPAFNREALLRRAVGSALAQTLKPLEIVVVDDGSADGTASLAESLGARVIRHGANRGAAAARNTGIAAARGALVAFLDSDDAWFPEKLAVQVPALLASGREVSCHGVRMHLLDHGIERDQPLADSEDWFTRLALDCNLSPGTTQLATKRALERVGPLDESLPRYEDWDWLLRFAAAGGAVLALPDLLAEVFNRRGRLGAQHELSARRFLAKHAGLHARLPPAMRRQAICDAWLQVSGTYAFEGKRAEALRVAAIAARQRPLHVAWRIARHFLGRVG